MTVLEPTAANFRHWGPRYFAATRPAFLSITLIGAVLGLAIAAAGGSRLDPVSSVVTVLFALVAHAAANVLNDYYDALNGTDALNGDRIYPFTGGSRFIQNGVLTLDQTRKLGYGLLAAVAPAGLWLAWHAGVALIPIGVCGLLLAWGYSAPPLQLMSRGLGELAIAAGWMLIVCGSAFVQGASLGPSTVVTALPFALLAAAILYINQFPDYRADRAAGKRTLVVRLGPRAARAGYAILVLLAYGILAWALAAHRLPLPAALALVALPVSAFCAAGLWRHAEEPEQLAPAIKGSIAAANLAGILLALGWLV